MNKVSRITDDKLGVILVSRCAKFEADIFASKLRRQEKRLQECGGSGNYSLIEVKEDERYARVFNDKKGFYVQATFSATTLALHERFEKVV